MMTYFTADQHFGHFNIIRLSHRPFASLEEMNESMITSARRQSSQFCND